MIIASNRLEQLTWWLISGRLLIVRVVAVGLLVVIGGHYVLKDGGVLAHAICSRGLLCHLIISIGFFFNIN